MFRALVGAVAALLLSTATHAQDRRIVKDAIGCKSKEQQSKMTQYAVQGDNEAFAKAALAGIVSGQCAMFQPGEAVFVTDTSLLSGLIKIRRKGQTGEFWMYIEAVK